MALAERICQESDSAEESVFCCGVRIRYSFPPFLFNKTTETRPKTNTNTHRPAEAVSLFDETCHKPTKRTKATHSKAERDNKSMKRP